MKPALLLALERFLLPNACVACGGEVEARTPDGLVCGLCRSRLREVGKGCDRCQQPLPPIGPCRFCRAWPPGLRTVASAVWLDARARPLVHALKYAGLHRVGGEMAVIMARHLAPPTAGLLVPVPLAPGREHRRGYNQAAVLARALGERWGLPVSIGVLTRVRETATQTALAPAARHRNMDGAFRGRPPLSRDEGPQPAVILVDDVLTTGATLVACATALGAVGWTSVDAVTFARALPYELRVA